MVQVKQCVYCGKEYTLSHPAQKYCSTNCKRAGYKQKQKQAKKKYKQKRKNTSLIKKCRWCGNTFTTTNNTQYCSDTCRKYAIQEKNLLAVYRYKKKVKNDKQLYFAYLGNSNIREGMKNNFRDELNVVEAEMRRLGIK